MDFFKNKVCLITGASTGIGFELARQLLESGAVVYLASRKAENQVEAKEALKEYGDRANFSLVNIKEEDSVRSWIEKAYEEQRRIDILINNAGVGSSGVSSEIPIYKWKAVLDTNLMGVIYGIHYVLPIMEKQGFGHIINVSSLAGLLPIPYQSVYVASKFAVTGLSESLRHELKGKGINVSVACPGNVITPVFEKGQIPPPSDAIETEYAVKYLLNNIAEGKTGIIPAAEGALELWNTYRLDGGKAEMIMSKIAALRKDVFEHNDEINADTFSMCSMLDK